MLIAQITDSHLLTGGRKLADRFDTQSAFDRLIDSLARQPVKPDLILFSGDLGENATADEYAYIGDALRKLQIPVRAVPGNHDKRAPMLAQLPDMVSVTDEGYLCVVETGFDLAIVGLDTIVENAAHGVLCSDRLAWIDRTLTTLAGRPVLIFMHHPPIKTGLVAMDKIGLLEGGDAFLKMIARHGQVEAILCGHMHRAIHGHLGNISVQVSPSASHQIAFDIRSDQPYRLIGEPAQYMMHLWDRENRLISHTVPVDNPS